MQTSPSLLPGALFAALCLCLAALLAGFAAPATSPAPAIPVGADWVLRQGTIQLRDASYRVCRQRDTLYVADWMGPGFGHQVVAYGGEAKRMEDLFEEQQGVLWVDGVGYRVSDGVFRGIEGARAWVAVHPRPLAASPAGLHVALFELAGKIYYGGLQRAAGHAAAHCPGG